MSIETMTTTTIRCDKCGRAIAGGEEWFQVTHTTASGIFDGVTAGLVGVETVTVQLCAADYAKDGAPAVALLTPPAPLLEPAAATV